MGLPQTLLFAIAVLRASPIRADPRHPWSVQLPESGGRLYAGRRSADNAVMELRGHVQNGVVVLEGETTLREGTRVIVVPCDEPVALVAKKRRRVTLPLVHSDQPGTLNLTNERIAEILEEEDIARYQDSFGQSTGSLPDSEREPPRP